MKSTVVVQNTTVVVTVGIFYYPIVCVPLSYATDHFRWEPVLPETFYDSPEVEEFTSVRAGSKKPRIW